MKKYYPFYIESTDELVNNHREYIASKWWNKRKTRFTAKYKKVCGLCRTNESKAYDLHHLSYKRKGKERDGDLVFLCKKCHLNIHKCRPSEVARIKMKRVLKKPRKKKRK